MAATKTRRYRAKREETYDTYKIKTQYFATGTISNDPRWFQKLKENGNYLVTVICDYTGQTFEAEASLILETAQHLPMLRPNPEGRLTYFKVARFR